MCGSSRIPTPQGCVDLYVECCKEAQILELMLDFLFRVTVSELFVNVWLMCSHSIETELEAPSWDINDTLQSYMISDTVTVDEVLKSVYERSDMLQELIAELQEYPPIAPIQPLEF